MSIELIIRPPFCDEPTTLSGEGDYEDVAMSICISALLAAGYEVLIENSTGDLIDYEDYEHE